MTRISLTLVGFVLFSLVDWGQQHRNREIFGRFRPILRWDHRIRGKLSLTGSTNDNIYIWSFNSGNRSGDQDFPLPELITHDAYHFPLPIAYCWVDWAKIWPIVQMSSQTRNMWNVAKNTIILYCNGGRQAFQSTVQVRILRIDVWWRDCNLKVQKKIEKWSLQWESNPRPYAY